MATAYALRAYEGMVLRNRRTWRSMLSFAVLGPLLSLAALGLGLGSLVARRAPAALDGVPYGEFLAPGLFAAAAMQMASAEATWPVMSAVRWDRSYQAALATPLTVADVYYGHLLWIATRLAVACAAFLVAASAVGVGFGWRALTALPAGVLTGMAFAAPTAAWAVGRKAEQSFATHYRVVLMPLYLFSGTVFPLATLPGAMRVVVQALPLWHGVALCRGLLLGDLGVVAGALHASYLLALCLAGVAVGRRTYARALAS